MNRFCRAPRLALALLLATGSVFFANRATGSERWTDEVEPAVRRAPRDAAPLEINSVEFAGGDRLARHGRANPFRQWRKGHDHATEEAWLNFAESPIARFAQSGDNDRDSDTSARDETVRWTPDPIGSVGVNIGLPSGDLPTNHAASQATWCPSSCTRGWGGLRYCYCAPCLCHKPLYFEEVNLERYGYGCHRCLQPAASAAHFFFRVPMLPYMMATDCPGECVYTLGHYRPGNCNPWRRHCLRPTSGNVFVEAAAITALVFILP